MARKTSCMAGATPDDSICDGDHGLGGSIRTPATVRHGTRDQGDGVVDVERLRQVLVRPAPVGGYRAVEVRIAGHDDHREVRVPRPDLAEELQTVHVRHPDVGHDRVRHAHLQPRGHSASALEPPDGESGAAEGTLQHPPNGLIIVDDPDLAHAAHSLSPGASGTIGSTDSTGSRMLNVVSPGVLSHSTIPPWS